ncbi:Aldehyde/histidinol dehydrogenase [Radiomyces spectabilis]|uniref:Aldehyde/histidinol dehydrogenase n=1 Tax=Radiomyces spectabilis TaxID=64574 RepID=UPI00221F3B75|nr:Aldehyde/histidinol dehydrogenase [Radiomyces spectabilis]KAI8369621.1 Aldehyde/histidinol dehydrogenase [Radiomyces spectabilis]
MAAQLTYTTFDVIEDSVSCLRGTFTTGKSRDLFWRKFQLERLYSLVKDNEERFYEALAKDMNKPRVEALSGDISPVLEECIYFIDNIDRLARDEKVKSRSILNSMDKLVVRRDALGVVCIIGTWNYPVQLALVPLAGAIAAGNSVVLKLSEISVHTSALITELFPKYMDSSLYRIVNGGVTETTELLKQHFDHIFYTGNSAVGKIVMEAAAKHLTPVTLELGGKSPAIVTPQVNIETVVNRIAFGKFYNGGQTCVAVDYVLLHRSLLDPFVSAMRKTITKWFGHNPKHSKDYARMISVRHLDQMAHVLNNRQTGTVAIGGEFDREACYFAPTVVTDVKYNDSALMTSEIFGPILPVVLYDTVDEAISVVTKNAPPLVLYIFSKQKSTVDKILQLTQSGGVCVNDTLMHQAEYGLPFGGVGNSGMGNYHGEQSFKTFTHERSIMKKKQRLESLVSLRYPPYTSKTYTILRMFLLTHPAMVYYKVNRWPMRIGAILIVLVAILLKKKL